MADAKVMTMEEVVKSDPNDWGDAEIDTIAAEAQKERDIESGKIKPEEKKEELKAKEPEAEEVKEGSEEKDQATKDAEAKAAKEKKEAEEAEAKKKDDERILKADDKDLKDEEKTRKVELVKEKEEAEKKAEEETIKAFAEAKKLPIEEAKKEREHIKAIRAKYKDSPDELSYAMLNAQRAMTKAQEEAKHLREYAPVRNIEKMTRDEILEEYLDHGKIKFKGVAITRESALDQFRNAKPDITDGMDDDKVLSLIADNIRQHMVLKAKENLVNSKVAAKDRREQVIASLSEADKKYEQEIREVVNAMPDQAILGEGFSIQDVALWAKGKKVEEIESNFQAEVKKSYDEGYRKGKEEAKILGVKAEEKKPSGNASKKTVTLNEAQKKEALDMFDTDAMTDEEKFDAYIDVKKKKEK